MQNEINLPTIISVTNDFSLILVSDAINVLTFHKLLITSARPVYLSAERKTSLQLKMFPLDQSHQEDIAVVT